MLYGVLSFICLALEGFGNGCLIAAIWSVITYNYPQSISSYIPLYQISMGIGRTSGIMIGSILYKAGGFKMPYYVNGTLFIMLIFPILCFYVEINRTNIKDK